MDTLFGIQAALHQAYPENSVTPYEALRMYTIDAAKTCFDQERKGSLKIGKAGDITVLAGNPLTADRREIASIPVLYTIKDGTIVYQADQARGLF